MAKTAAIIGGGVIGGGWLARFVLNGWNVRVFDPDPEAERKINVVLDQARHALPMLYETSLPVEGSVTYCSHIGDTVIGVDWIQESVPERLDVKHAVIADIQAHASEQAVLAGGHVRVGLEDNLWLEKGVLATNEALVARAVGIIEGLGATVMGPDQVRQKLNLTQQLPRAS